MVLWSATLIFKYDLDKFAFKPLSGGSHSSCPSLRFNSFQNVWRDFVQKEDGWPERDEPHCLPPHAAPLVFSTSHFHPCHLTEPLMKPPAGYHSCPTGCLQPFAACETDFLSPGLQYGPWIMAFSRWRDGPDTPGHVQCGDSIKCLHVDVQPIRKPSQWEPLEIVNERLQLASPI